jgi:hypothetical protein
MLIALTGRRKSLGFPLNLPQASFEPTLPCLELRQIERPGGGGIDKTLDLAAPLALASLLGVLASRSRTVAQPPRTSASDALSEAGRIGQDLAEVGPDGCVQAMGCPPWRMTHSRSAPREIFGGALAGVEGRAPIGPDPLGQATPLPAHASPQEILVPGSARGQVPLAGQPHLPTVEARLADERQHTHRAPCVGGTRAQRLVGAIDRRRFDQRSTSLGRDRFGLVPVGNAVGGMVAANLPEAGGLPGGLATGRADLLGDQALGDPTPGPAVFALPGKMRRTTSASLSSIRTPLGARDAGRS